MTTDPTLDEVRDSYVADDVQAVAEYRSVSILAVAALLLGLVSAVALIGTHLLVVNLLAIICAALALVRIARSEGQLIGRNVALAGLALSIGFGAYAYVHYAVFNRLVAREAQQWGLDWCKLVRDGELTLALELQNPPTSRRPLDSTLSQHYAGDPEGQEQLKSFREDPVVEALTSAPEGATLEAGEVEQVVRRGPGQYVVVRQYRLVPASPSEGEPVVIRLQMNRIRLERLGGNAWFLSEMALKS